jgi:peptide/nickel transport system substrate-binding protein
VTKRRLAAIAIMATVGALALLAAGCGGGDDEAAEETAPAETTTAEETTAEETTAEETGAAETTALVEGEAEPGGTYRVDVETSFDFTADFDPTAEYTAVGWSFYNLMLRKLMSYRMTAGAEGNEAVPDLAAAPPEISADGLTYTFTLKDGIMFGPPVSREITSQDIKYAFDRLANPDIGAFGYPGYYTIIDGFEAVQSGEADSVSGITTPDDKTIVFQLTQPTGDFPYRVAMAAAAPIPEEVAKCFTEAGGYGRYVISSGPYMIEGSDQLDITSCDTMQPIAGYDPEAHLNFVRNPNYDQATDDLRLNYPDEFQFTINTNNDDCFNKTLAGQIDDNLCSETPKIIRQYTEDPELEDNLKLNPDDGVWYLYMNLTQPPFDDVHVRKAMNLVMDKTAFRAAWGGPPVGEIATHILPSYLAPPDLAGYDPYPSPDFRGDVEAAKAEMAQSKYDTDGDGICDAPECKGVVNIMGNTERDRGLVPIIEDGASKIGVEFKSRNLDSPYEFIFTPTEKVPFSGTAGWGKDYADAYTYFLYLFDGRTITPEFSYNEPLVGLTEELAQEIGIEWPEGGVPSVDPDIDNCIGIADATERFSCWGDLDKKLMEEVVPWIPWLWRNYSNTISDAVTRWDFDQSTGMQAWTQVAVDPSKQG